MEDVSVGHGNKALSQRRSRGRTVEVFVLSLTQVGDCRGECNRDKRRLRAELLRGGRQDLRMDRLNTLLEWLTFLDLFFKESHCDI